MQRIVLYVVYSLVFTISLSAQEASFRYNDSLTYSQYLEKNWTDLVRSGEKALGYGHDYYYLRMRLGIAYYEKHNYASAARHFRKAQEFSLNDEVSTEYLFYCSYLSDRPYQAWSELAGTFGESRSRIIKESNFGMNNLTGDVYYSNFNTDGLLQNPGELFNATVAGSQSISRYFINNSVYGSHILGKGFAYSHAYTFLLKSSFLHYSDGTSEADMPDQRLIQNQYYGAFNFFGRKGWLFTPAFHVLLTAYPYFYKTGSGMNTSIVTRNYNDLSYLASFQIVRRGGFLSIGADAGFSQLNYLMQAQGSAFMTLYPLGNSSLYLGGKVSTVFSFEEDQKEFPLIYGLSFGFAIKSKVWFDFSGLDGYTFNYTEGNGLIIYNGADVLTRKLNGRIVVPLGRSGVTLYGGCGRSWYVSEWINPEGVSNGYSNNIEYFSNNITGGISWNF